MLDRKLLKQALEELVRLKSCVHDPLRVLGRLYDSALEEWADRLNVEPPKLSKLVVIKEAISTHRHHENRRFRSPSFRNSRSAKKFKVSSCRHLSRSNY